jgi:hypothetical protein
MKLLKLTCTASAIAAASLLAGCATWNDMDRSERGLAAGAAGGGLIGAAVGGPVGAVVGVGVGGYAGAKEGLPPRHLRHRPVAATTYDTYPGSTYTYSSTYPTTYYSSSYSSPIAMNDPIIIRDAQQSLAYRGYRPGVIDGRWGPNTQNAVLVFQRSNGLAETGVLDRTTLYALNVIP